jgi:hypothetical protein
LCQFLLAVKNLAALRLLRAVQGGDAVFGVDYKRAHCESPAAGAAIDSSLWCPVQASEIYTNNLDFFRCLIRRDRVTQ